MPLEVLLTAAAHQDLAAIYEHIAETEGRERADRVIERLEERSARLVEFPQRGSYPREMLALGIREYRQVLVDPYRVIYHVTGRRVVIDMIADSHRDMQSLLARRLLGA